jgi:hypothetical protein
VVFVFASVNVLYYIYRFRYVEPPLHPWDEVDLIMVNDLSDSVCHYFIKDFYIDVHEGVGLFFSFLEVFLSSFRDECNTGFIK